MMPLFCRSKKFRCFFFKDPPIFPLFATIWAAKIGKVRSPKYIIQRNSEIKGATNFLKLIYNFISAKQLLVLPITFFFCESSIKCDSGIIILKWSLPSREIGEKVGKCVMVQELGQRKMKYLKISCCRVPNQHRNIQHQNVLTS